MMMMMVMMMMMMMMIKMRMVTVTFTDSCADGHRKMWSGFSLQILYLYHMFRDSDSSSPSSSAAASLLSSSWPPSSLCITTTAIISISIITITTKTPFLVVDRAIFSITYTPSMNPSSGSRAFASSSAPSNIASSGACASPESCGKSKSKSCLRVHGSLRIRLGFWRVWFGFGVQHLCCEFWSCGVSVISNALRL